MVHVGVMRVGVPHHLMVVLVRVRLAAIPREGVRVLVVNIVPMRMAVGERFVNVLVLMSLRQMQPHPARHEQRRRRKPP